MKDNKVIKFPEDKIVRLPDNIGKEKPKGFHQKQIEELLWRLEYEFTKGIDVGEFDKNEEFRYNSILPMKREDGKFTKLMVALYPTEYPF